MTNGTIHQENITVIHTHAPNIGALKYIKQILTDLKGEIDSNTILVGVLKVPYVFGDKQKGKYNIPKLTGCSKSSSRREVHSNEFLPQETKISSNLTLHLKELEKKNKRSSKICSEVLFHFY